jgi:tetratricopeptide (TPR) repeat protein
MRMTANWFHRPARAWRTLLLCLALPLLHAPASAAPAEAFDLHKKGQYEQAAASGLEALKQEPANHELRFIVADSLQRTDKTDQAIKQFEALLGTPFAPAATIRLNVLRGPGAAPLRSAPAPAGTAKIADSYQYVQPSGAGLFGANQPQTVFQQRAAAADPAKPAKTWKPEEQHILDLSAKGDYRGAGSAGQALLAKEKPDDELVLAIANALAWSGRGNEAIPVYKRLEGGAYAHDGAVGRANLIRWSGRDDLAVPLYRQVLAAESAHPGALEGLEMAVRELRPKTTISIGAAEDSNPMKRRSATINHRWRDASGANAMEIELSGVRDRLPDAQASQAEVTLRYRALGLDLKPSFELSLPNGEQRTLFGKVGIRPSQHPDTLIEAGRVNWGRMAFNANALAQHMTANHIGLEAADDFFFGRLSGRADFYDLSDGNRIATGSVRLIGSWRPLGPYIKPYIGIETRDAGFHSTNYWSPEQGYGSMYTGLQGDWGAADWNLYAAAQVGFRLWGEAARSWAVNAGGKRWLSNDLALSMNLWALDSWRDNASYRAKAVNVHLEKLWR